MSKITTQILQVISNKRNVVDVPTGSAAAVAAGMAAFATGSDWVGSLRIPVSVTSFYAKWSNRHERGCMNFDALNVRCKLPPLPAFEADQLGRYVLNYSNGIHHLGNFILLSTFLVANTCNLSRFSSSGWQTGMNQRGACLASKGFKA